MRAVTQLCGEHRRLAIIGLAPARGLPGAALDVGAPTGRRLEDLLGRPVHSIACTANVLDRHDAPIRGAEACRAGRELHDLLVAEQVHRVVVLGMDAARLMGLRWGVPSSSVWFDWGGMAGDRLYYAVAPHPSGRSRWWNDRSNFLLAKSFFRKVAADTEHVLPRTT